MNYFNPYFSTFPYGYTPAVTTSKGLLGGFFSGGKLSSIINGTQKTLNVVNQAIPLVQQLSPIMKNAKTMFRVMNEFKKEEPTNIKSQNIIQNDHALEQQENKISEEKNNNIGPTFFL